MRRAFAVAVAGLLLSSAPVHAQTASNPPGVAVGEVHQEWNAVTVDYGVGDPATTELHVRTHDGRDVVVDRKTALDGTLVWNRKIDNHHVAPGRYVLAVVATNTGGTSSSFIRINLGLVYVGTQVQTSHGDAVLRYTLAEKARVRLFVRKVGTRRWQLAERRTGVRGHNRITWDFRVHGQRVHGGRYQMLLRAVSLAPG